MINSQVCLEHIAQAVGVDVSEVRDKFTVQHWKDIIFTGDIELFAKYLEATEAKKLRNVFGTGLIYKRNKMDVCPDSAITRFEYVLFVLEMNIRRFMKEYGSDYDII